MSSEGRGPLSTAHTTWSSPGKKPTAQGRAESCGGDGGETQGSPLSPVGMMGEETQGSPLSPVGVMGGETQGSPLSPVGVMGASLPE